MTFAYASSLSSACGLLRIASPYSLLGATLSERPPNIVDLLRHDTFVFSRPMTEDILASMAQARACGAKIIVDWDDAFWCIPQWNPAHQAIAKHLPIIERCCRMAHAFTATCKTLAEELEARYGMKTTVLPNAYDDRFMFRTPETLSPGVVVIRGSSTHEKDYALFESQIYKARHGGFQFIWLGYQPYWANGDAFIPWTNTYDYFTRILPSIHPEFVFTPLEDNLFNHCKSNIAMIEAGLMSSFHIRLFNGGNFPLIDSLYQARTHYEEAVDNAWEHISSANIRQVNQDREPLL